MGGTLIARTRSLATPNGSLRPKQVRESLKTGDFVVLLEFYRYTTRYSQSMEASREVWVVLDILFGTQFEIEPQHLGPEANEMEVIAWAAK